jgi:hypothetical protein
MRFLKRALRRLVWKRRARMVARTLDRLELAFKAGNYSRTERKLIWRGFVSSADYRSDIIKLLSRV